MRLGHRRWAALLLVLGAPLSCAAAPELGPDDGESDPGDELGVVSLGEPRAPSEPVEPRSSGAAAPTPPGAPPGPLPPALQDENPSEAEALTKCSADTMQWWRKNKDRDVTFVAFGDTQASSYAAGCHRNRHFRKKQDALLREAINSVEDHVWPGGPGFHREGEKYDHVRGVLVAGDLTQSGSDAVPVGKLDHDCPEYTLYRNAFGRCGDEGKLKFPVYEGYGNHDFPWVAGAGDASYHPVVEYLDRITAAHRPGEASELYDDPVPGTGHYAWRWDDVWFVNMDVKPGWLNEVIEKDHTRIVDPHDSLGFLQGFLDSRSKNETRQIVLMTHYPLSSPRIEAKETRKLCKLLRQAQDDQKLSRSFPVVHIHGHTHHEPVHKTWSCPAPYDDIRIPSFNVGTPLYPNEHNGPGKLHFTIFRLGNKNVEVVGVGADKADPTGKWSYVLKKRLGILHEP